MEEEKQDGNAGRPFQLRPSILSGSGFGSSFGGFGSPGDKTSKEFTLRPSSLTSATDHLETTLKSDSRKRLHEDESDASKVEEQETSKKVKTAGENGKTESPVKLTEDVQKPSGIGSFGFAQEDASKVNSKNKCEKRNSTSTTNFFQTCNTDSNKFVFGDNSNTTNTVGFNTLKSENDGVEEETEIGSTNGGDEEKECAATAIEKEKLLESADEYQKSLGQRTHLKEVEQITGEEGERNVLQVFCKLHLFDKQKQNWLEKGRGTLRLNDKCHSEGIFQSRLVFRTQGTNIVLLNMMLWQNMCCERVKEKSIRITAIDPNSKEVKVYLVTTAIKDCLQTYIAIDRRIEALKRNSDNSDDNKNDRTSAGSGGNSKPQTDDEDSSTESERISSRENSMYGPTDNDSSDQTSPGQTT